MYECVRVCMRACVRACVRVCVCKIWAGRRAHVRAQVDGETGGLNHEPPHDGDVRGEEVGAGVRRRPPDRPDWPGGPGLRGRAEAAASRARVPAVAPAAHAHGERLPRSGLRDQERVCERNWRRDRGVRKRHTRKQKCKQV